MVVPAVSSSSVSSSVQNARANSPKVRRRRRGAAAKRVYRRSVGRLALAVSATLAALFGSSRAFAKGSAGGIQVKGVSAGSATVQQTGRETRITASSQNTVIDYRSFNLGRRYTADFILPGRNSRILNRIDSATPSHIDGHVLSNGTVYFVNPAGVIFGPTAVIDVAGLYAAAAHLSNADFLAGINHFTGAQGAVVNNGRLKGDVVALVGRQVTNNGVILGKRAVTVVAGDDVLLGERFGNIYVKVTPPAAGAAPAPGAPTAATSLGSGDMYSLAIVNAGMIAAPQVQAQAGAKGQGGSAKVAGHVDASNNTGQGGSVTVTADTVAVTGATIDASGKSGGGTILVGGDAHGAGTLQNANTTTIDAASTLRADASGEHGAGGKVVVWSDNSTGFHGTISARGGSVSGDGGFVETSGHSLDTTGGTVNASAPHGSPGVWLLDPIGLDITTDPTNTSVDVDLTDPLKDVFAPHDPTAASKVSAAQLLLALDAGTSVMVQTTNDGGTSGNGKISVNAPIGMTGLGDATLTLKSVAGIDVNQPISSTGGKLGVTLSAAGGVQLNAAVATKGGDFNSQSASFTSSAAGKITADAGTVNVTTTGPGGPLQIGGDVTAGTVKLSAAGNVTFGPGGIAIHADAQSYTAVDPTAHGAQVDFTTNAPTFANSAGAAGLVSFTLDQDLAVKTSALPLTSGLGNITLKSEAAAVTVDTDVTAATTELSLSGKQGVAIQTGLTVAKLTVDAGGGVTMIAQDLTTAGNQTFTGSVQVAPGTINLTSTGGNVSFNDPVTLSGGPITLTAANVVFKGGVSNTAPTQLKVTGDLALAGDLGSATLRIGDLEITGNTTVSGAAVNVFAAGAKFDKKLSDADGKTTAVTVDATGLTTLGGAVSLDALIVTGTTEIDAAGTLLAPSVATGHKQTYQGAVKLGGDAVLKGSELDANGTSINANGHALGLVFDNGITLGGSSGVTLSNLDALSVGDPAATTHGTTHLAADVSAVNALTFNDPVSIDAATVSVTATAPTGKVAFFGKVSTTANSALTVSGPGGDEFHADVNLGDGSLHVAKGVTTVGDAAATGTTTVSTGAGDQTYDAAVALGSDAAFRGKDLTLAAVATPLDAQHHDLTLVFTQNQLAIDGTTLKDVHSLTVGDKDHDATKTATTVLSGVIKTELSQTYNDPVQLKGAGVSLQTALTAGTSVTFNNTIAGDASVVAGTDLATDTKLTTFEDHVGLTNPLGKLSFTGDVAFGDAARAAGGAVQVDAKGDVTFPGAVTSANASLANSHGTAVTINTPGTTTFGGAVSLGSLSVGTAAGHTHIDGGSVTTTGGDTGGGNQSYANAVTLGADTTVSAGTWTGATAPSQDIRFAAPVDGVPVAGVPQHGLAVNTAGDAMFADALTVRQLITEGGGTTTLGDASQPLLSQPAGAGKLTLAGALTLGGTLQLNTDATITSSNAPAASSNFLLHDVHAMVDAGPSFYDLTLNTPGGITFAGNVGEVLNGAPSATTTLTTRLGNLTATGSGIQLGQGGAPISVYTLRSQTYDTLTVTLGGNATLYSLASPPAFKAIGSGNVYGLEVRSGQVWTAHGAPAPSPATVNDRVILGLSYLRALGDTAPIGIPTPSSGGGGGGGGPTTPDPRRDVPLPVPNPGIVLAGTISVAQQDYYVPARIDPANAILQGVDIDFHQTLDGPGTLIVNATDHLVLQGNVGQLLPLKSLTVNGVTLLAPADVSPTPPPVLLLTTAETQTYNGDVELNRDAVLSNLATLKPNGAISFNRNVREPDPLDATKELTPAPYSLTVNTLGDTTFKGSVNVKNLTTDAPGQTVIGDAAVPPGTQLPGAGQIHSAGSQTFNDDVVLAAESVFADSASGPITFAKTVANGPGVVNGKGIGFTVNTSGNTTFRDAVTVDHLTTDAGGATILGGTGASGAGQITTAQFQDYGDAVQLNVDATLKSVGYTPIDPAIDQLRLTHDVTFRGVVQSMLDTSNGIAGNFQLSVDTAGTFGTPGTVAFGNDVGIESGSATLGTTRLRNLLVNTAESSATGLVQIGLAPNLGGAGNPTSTHQTITIKTSADQVFNTYSTGPATGVQLDADAVQIAGGSIQFVAVDGQNNSFDAFNLTLRPTSPMDLRGTPATFPQTPGYNYVARLGKLTVGDVADGGPSFHTNIQGHITTGEAQTFNDPVTLANDTTLEVSPLPGRDWPNLNVSFQTLAAIDGSFNLRVTTPGTAVFGKKVNAIGSLTVDGVAEVDGGLVSTTGDQHFRSDLFINESLDLTRDLLAHAPTAPNVVTDPVQFLSTGGKVLMDGRVTGDDVAVLGQTTGNGHAGDRGIVTAAQTVFFGNAVALGSLDVTAPLIQIAGPTVDTWGDAGRNASQVYHGHVALLSDVVSTAHDVSHGGDANGFARDVLFEGLVDGAASLDVHSSGLTGFTRVNIAGHLATDMPGLTAVVGGSITTGGGQSFGDPTYAAPNATFSPLPSQPVRGPGPLTQTTFADVGGQGITFRQSLIGYGETAVTTAGDITFNGAVVLFQGAGAAGSLSTGGGAVSPNSVITGRTFVAGNLVQTDGKQDFADDVVVRPDLSTSASPVTLAAPLTLALPALPNVPASPETLFQSLGNADVSFHRTLTGVSDVTVTTSGVTTFGQAVVLHGAAASASTVAVAGDLTTNGDKSVNNGGTTVVAGRIVQTDGKQDFADDVVVTPGAPTTPPVDPTVFPTSPVLTTFRSAGDRPITFERSLTGNDSVTVTTRGDTTFGGIVNLAQGSGNDGSLTTDDNPGGDPNALPGHTIVRGRLVLTDGSQHFADDVIVDPAQTDPSIPDTFATSTGTSDNVTTLPGHGVTLFKNTGKAGDKPIAFDGTLTGASDVTITTNDVTTLGGAVVLTRSTDPSATITGHGDLTVDGNPTATNPGTVVVAGRLVLTDGKQDFADDVALQPNANLRPFDPALRPLVPVAPETLFKNTAVAPTNGPVPTGAWDITFERTLTGTGFAHVTTDGTTTFGSIVSLNGSLLTDGNNADRLGLTVVKGRLVQTTGTQEFIDNVQLAPNDNLPTTALLPAFTLTGGNLPAFGMTLFKSTLDPATPTDDVVKFHGAVFGASDLTVTAAGKTTFRGEVVLTAGDSGHAAGNLVTNGTGLTEVDGRVVQTDGSQDFQEPVDVRPESRNSLAFLAVPLPSFTHFESMHDEFISFGGSLTGDDTVTVTTSGPTTFHRYVWLVQGNGNDGSLATNGHLSAPPTPKLWDVTYVEGRLVHTDGSQLFHDDVVVAPDATATGPADMPADPATTLFKSDSAVVPSEIHFFRTLTGTSNVIASTADNVTFGQYVDLRAGTNGSAGNLTTMGGTTLAPFDAAHGITVVQGRLIRTDGFQDFQDAVRVTPNLADPIVAGVSPAQTVFVSNGGAAVHFEQWLIGTDTVTVTTSGKTTFGGIVDLAAGNNNDGSLTTQGNTATTPGLTQVEGFLVRTDGSQDFKDDVSLAPSASAPASPESPRSVLQPPIGSPLTIFKSNQNNDINFERTLTGAGNAEVTTGRAAPDPLGLTTFGGPVNITGDLVTDGGGITTVAGRLVQTGGRQDFFDDVVVKSDSGWAASDPHGINGNPTTGIPAAGETLFVSTGNNAITFERTLKGTSNVAVNTGGMTTFKGEVNLVGSLTTDAPGTTTIGDPAGPNAGQVTTTSFQLYNDNVVLGTDAHTTSTGGGDVTFEGTVTGPHRLLTSTDGQAIFEDNVDIQSLTTGGYSADPAGSVLVNGHGTLAPLTIRTSEYQLYHNPVHLGGDATMTSTGAGDITFEGTVDGPHNMIVNTAGVTTFFKTVDVGTLVTDAPGKTVLKGGVGAGFTVRTTGYQDYNDDVEIDAATTFLGGSGDIAFHKTLKGDFDTLVTTAGQTTFHGAVDVGSLTTDGNGLTVIGDPAVLPNETIHTTRFQTYKDAVSLGTDALLTAGGDVTFATTVDGPHRLVVNTPADEIFGGAVNIGSLLTDQDHQGSATEGAHGFTRIRGGVVTTTGVQLYGDDVRIETANATLNAGDDVTFFATVKGTPTLTVNNTVHTTTFDGAVDVGALTTDAGGVTNINGGSVNTSAGDQLYQDDTVVLAIPGGGVDKLTSAGNITFKGFVHGDQTATGLDATVAANHTLEFDKDVAVAQLVVEKTGKALINTAHVKTNGGKGNGGQTYRNAVAFTENLILTDVAGQSISFEATSSLTEKTSGLSLAINTAGDTFIAGAAKVGTFTSDAADATQIDGARILGGRTHVSGQLSADKAVLFNDTAALEKNGQVISSGSTVTFNGNAELSAAAGLVQTKVGGDAGAVEFNGQVSRGSGITWVVTHGSKVDFNQLVYGPTLNLIVDTTLALGANSTLSLRSLQRADSYAAFTRTTVGQWLGDVTFHQDAVVGSLAVTARNVTAHAGSARHGDISLQPDPQLTLFPANTTGQNGAAVEQNFLPYSMQTSGVSARARRAAGGTSTATPGTIPPSTQWPKSPDGVLTLNGSLDASGNIVLAPVARLDPATGKPIVAAAATIQMIPATIASTLADATPAQIHALPAMEITAGGSVVMGPQEKLTVLGSLHLQAGGGSKGPKGTFAEISDISTFGDLTVSAPAIVVNLRGPGNVLDSLGRASNKDAGVDYFAGGVMLFDGILDAYPSPTSASVPFTLPLDGSGLGGLRAPTVREVAFGITNGSIGGSAGIASYPFHMHVDKQLTVAEFLFQGFPSATTTGATTSFSPLGTGPVVLDATPDGPSSTAIAGVLAQALPGQLPQPTEDENITGAIKEQLKEMGIHARDLTLAEIVDRAIGRVRYIEVPEDKAVIAPEDLKIAASRIPLGIAQQVLDARYEILGIGPMPTDGGPLEEDWKAKAAARKEQIRQDLEGAFKDYLTETKKEADDADATEFRTFVENHYDRYANVVNLFDLIRSTLTAAEKKIALTPAQARSCRDALIAGLIPDHTAGKMVMSFLPDDVAVTAAEKLNPPDGDQGKPQTEPQPQKPPAAPPTPPADDTSASAVPASATNAGSESR